MNRLKERWTGGEALTTVIWFAIATVMFFGAALLIGFLIGSVIRALL